MTFFADQLSQQLAAIFAGAKGVGEDRVSRRILIFCTGSGSDELRLRRFFTRNALRPRRPAMASISRTKPSRSKTGARL
jgi:hypothetical protein